MSTVIVHQSNCELRLLNNQYVISSSDKEKVAQIPELQAERIIVMGNAQLSTPLIKRCLKNGTDIIYMSEYGHYFGQLESSESKKTARFVKQVKEFSCNKKSLKWSKALLEAKMQGIFIELRRMQNNQWITCKEEAKNIEKTRKKIMRSRNLSQLMGYEANAVKEYYKAFAKALPENFPWQGRNRRPPKDPVNSLISLSSVFLQQRFVNECRLQGLQEELGFLHGFEYRRPNLALDLMEPLRSPVCDHLVLLILRDQKLTKEDFYYDGEACKLKQDSFKKFISIFEEDFNKIGNRSASPAKMVNEIVISCKNALENEKVADFLSVLSKK